jgi:peptidoglycan hydrolase-like protein with peptidoglycan-binding domain
MKFAQLSLLAGALAFTAATPAMLHAQSDKEKKTEDKFDRAGDATKGAVEKAGEVTGKGVGAAVEHTGRSVTKAGEATGSAVKRAGGAVADFFDGDADDTYTVDRVRAAQQALKDKGYYSGKIDGIPGPQTRSALREFQGDNELKETGKINDETAKKLGV